MRHGKKINHLSRKSGHRRAMLSNMANSLIMHKRINTTVAKAKALRVYVEPIITKSKDDSTHSRRVVFGYLQDKTAVSELFREVAPKIAQRPGGYTRIIKLGQRQGDNAEMCMIELVDYNELMLQEKSTKKTTRRSRRGGSGTKKDTSSQTTEATTKPTENKTKPAEAAAVADAVEPTETVAEPTEAKNEVAEDTNEVVVEPTKVVAEPVEAKEEKPETEAKAKDTQDEAKEEPKAEKKDDKKDDKK